MTRRDMDINEPGADRLQQYETVIRSITELKKPLDTYSIHVIEELIKDLDKPGDPVYQGNCLQLIADLAGSRQALALLDEKQVPSKLINLLNQQDTLIVPHALKFFYRIDPSDLETKYSLVLEIIFNYCQSDDRQLLDYAIDFIAAVGRHGYTARKLLDRHPHFASKCLTKLGSTIISSDSLLKCRTLECIRDLIQLQEEDPIEDSSNLSKKFYNSIIEGENKMTNQLLSLCRVPFREISASAVLVVKAVNEFTWGQQELASQPELLKFAKN